MIDLPAEEEILSERMNRPADGFPEYGMLGDGCYDEWDEDWDDSHTPEELLEMLRNVTTEGSRFETRHRRKDGTYIDVGSGHPVADNVSFWFYLKGWSGLDTPEAARLAFEVLQDAEWVRAVNETPSPTGGRPAVRYAINPGVWR